MIHLPLIAILVTFDGLPWRHPDDLPGHFDTRLWPEGIILEIEREWLETEVKSNP